MLDEHGMMIFGLNLSWFPFCDKDLFRLTLAAGSLRQVNPPVSALIPIFIYKGMK
jgi:hypothetical protein